MTFGSRFMYERVTRGGKKDKGAVGRSQPGGFLTTGNLEYESL